MEGTSETFDELLADFARRLPEADFVALDLEMTGTGGDVGADSLLQSVEERYARVREAAETFTLCQIGLTLGRWAGEGEGAAVSLSSYNIFAFPFFVERKVVSHFKCTAAGVRFLSRNGFDFNRWIRSGVAFRTRQAAEAESQGAANPLANDGRDGLLRLWGLLCEAQKPLVTHSGLTDLAFLLAALETSPLPDNGSRFAEVVRRLTPQVFDTAHLFAAVGGEVGAFKRLGLAKFLEEAEERASGRVRFVPEGEATQGRYGAGGQAHEAGYDSFMTAKLFACLRALAPEVVQREADRLYLWKSTECVDLSRGDLRGTLVAPYAECAAFVAEFPAGTAASAGELGGLGRHGGNSEVVDDKRAVVLWPRHLTPEARQAALPGAATWLPAACPPRRPHEPAVAAPKRLAAKRTAAAKRPAAAAKRTVAAKRPAAAKKTAAAKKPLAAKRPAAAKSPAAARRKR